MRTPADEPAQLPVTLGAAGALTPVPEPDQLPALVALSSAATVFAWEEFFSGRVRNAHTRAAYLHAHFAKFGCYECHGREAQGSTATGPRLGPNPIAYNRFIAYIRKPAGEMPPYTAKVVTEQQAADIYAFLQSLPRPPAAETIPLLK